MNKTQIYEKQFQIPVFQTLENTKIQNDVPSNSTPEEKEKEKEKRKKEKSQWMKTQI